MQLWVSESAEVAAIICNEYSQVSYTRTQVQWLKHACVHAPRKNKCLICRHIYLTNVSSGWWLYQFSFFVIFVAKGAGKEIHLQIQGSLLLQLSNMRCSCHSSLRNTIPTEYILCKLMEKPGKVLQGFQLLRDCRLPGIRCALILSMCIYLKDIMEKHHTIFLSNKKKLFGLRFPIRSTQTTIKCSLCGTSCCATS